MDVRKTWETAQGNDRVWKLGSAPAALCDMPGRLISGPELQNTAGRRCSSRLRPQPTLRSPGGVYLLLAPRINDQGPHARSFIRVAADKEEPPTRDRVAAGNVSLWRSLGNCTALRIASGLDHDR